MLSCYVKFYCLEDGMINECEWWACLVIDVYCVSSTWQTTDYQVYKDQNWKYFDRCYEFWV